MQVTGPHLDLDIRAYYTPPKFEGGTVMVCHHGAGYSGLSFACVAKEVTDMSRGECGVLSYDCRGHGTSMSTREHDMHGARLIRHRENKDPFQPGAGEPRRRRSHCGPRQPHSYCLPGR